MPGLRLTQENAQRPWNLDATTFRAVLAARTETRILEDAGRHLCLSVGPAPRRHLVMESAIIKLKLVYDPVSRTDATQFLVERLWPRGLSEELAEAFLVGRLSL